VLPLRGGQGSFCLLSEKHGAVCSIRKTARPLTLTFPSMLAPHPRLPAPPDPNKTTIDKSLLAFATWPTTIVPKRRWKFVIFPRSARRKCTRKAVPQPGMSAAIELPVCRAIRFKSLTWVSSMLVQKDGDYALIIANRGSSIESKTGVLNKGHP
jgi:hypothetical protein